ncbi:MAG TPA: hypothetical protein VFS36_06430 [Chitinophagaceae bacterium]|nr:hypothetical protein [Chitinophagaceae bacterium]
MKTNVQAMPENVKERVVAFICGDVSVMGFTFLKIPDEMMHLGWKITATLIIGLAGGVAGVAGKDLYAFAKRLVTKKNKS